MKKLAVLLLMGLTVFSLSACGSEPVEETTEVTKEVEEVEEVVEENVSEEPVETEVEEVVEEPEEDGVKITNISVDDPNGEAGTVGYAFIDGVAEVEGLADGFRSESTK